jgi:hypothetical protein
MAFLPLTSFNLHLPPQCFGCVPEAVGIRLNLRAKDVLLKDPMLPEEKQVKPISTSSKAVEESEEEEEEEEEEEKKRRISSGKASKTPRVITG